MTKPTSQQHSHQAKKRFGQNFLVDGNIINRIIGAIKPLAGEHLVEIGPGLGALTRHLVDKNCQLDVVEIDRDLAQKLELQYADTPHFKLHQMDALKADFGALASAERSLRVIGNLPYNISTPLLFHLLTFKACIHDMHFMLQKEVVDRLASPEGKKTYGRLSVMVQYHCHIEPLFVVPPSAFKPAPKVESAIVRLRPRSRTTTVTDPKFFAQMVNVCFQQRRKTIRNGLKLILKELPEDCLADIDLGRRPETFSVEEFIAMANQLSALR
ncbi:MAG: 16S rRNA (adenine(1518)-N(6)/adenine(1519)-N(6))-dimethyltransferase RsmA [Gammaproteobacteria bacterium]|nr:16S rRNA (adenine(1518)-N(6)/adenine(1519)-N(6))-dimethyltransferase RsmA [Gammaproteobacteria bacterium]MBQ0839463.1 16S rRNA (adenine(1518)-N(6)/adenine(1519)-N(6))-dimethyltransferase RsmA [Gammaproteobacteria bacterium]